MKEKLKVINNEFKEKLFKSLELERQAIINQLVDNQDELLKLNPYEKLICLYPYISELSCFNDYEVISLIKFFGVSEDTAEIFVSHLDLFVDLDEHQKKSNYLFPYEIIWGYYRLYNLSVIIKRMSSDFKINLSKIGKKINRQEKGKRIPNVLKTQLDNLKKQRDLINTKMPGFKFPINDENTVNSVFHIIKYPHRNELYNLYELLADFNRKTRFLDSSEADFKYEFYLLLKIIAKGSKFLNDKKDKYEDTPSNAYINERQFITKLITSLLK